MPFANFRRQVYFYNYLNQLAYQKASCGGNGSSASPHTDQGHMASRLGTRFFSQDVLVVAPKLLGKKLFVRRGENVTWYTIRETEAYRGTEDLACHASKGKTARNSIMFATGGHIYVYMIYGMYWLLNIVTGKEEEPQAVFIRCLEGCNGPGILSRKLGIDRSFYGENLATSRRIWVENGHAGGRITSGPRKNVDYAGDYWKNLPWRFWLETEPCPR